MNKRVKIPLKLSSSLGLKTYFVSISVLMILWIGFGQPTAAFDLSAINALRRGDDVTPDMLDELNAFLDIINKPLSVGVFLSGTMGPPGSLGRTGRPGKRGTMGNEGPVGENGATGLDGMIGPRGLRGPAGHRGPPGLPGQRGPTGQRGPQGEQGRAGVKGYELYSSSLVGKTDQMMNVSLLKDEQESMSYEQQKIVCEGEKSWMECKVYENIKINDAFWGRDDFVTCSHRYHDNQTIQQYNLIANGDGVVLKVKENCDVRPACELVASRTFFDDYDDSDVPKYLRVNYECTPEVYEDEFVFRERRHSDSDWTRGYEGWRRRRDVDWKFRPRQKQLAEIHLEDKII